MKGYGLSLLLTVLALLAACTRLPVLQPAAANMPASLPAACRAVFPQGKWQSTHAIEVAYPGGGEQLLMGVTVVDASAKSIACALMTVEGFVLFQARLDAAVRVERAVPPFDRKGFATGLLADIRLMFMEPATDSVATGSVAGPGNAEGRPACRYTDRKGSITDVLPGNGNNWRVALYGPRGQLTRTVSADPAGGQAGFPGRLQLTAHGAAGYTLKMKLVDVVHIDE
jgi:hypothetical protein